MPYVHRNKEEIIIGIAAMPQGGWGKEFLPDDHTDILRFFSPPATWDDIRSKRATKLFTSDWVALIDCQLSDKDKKSWAEYRQKLRDVPQDFNAPDDVIWPNFPK